MHCASLGEFEQGRPVLENLRNVYPSAKIVLSFFSPSGYEIRKDYSGADQVIYLPMDSAKNASEFINTIQPSLVIWIKYEYWYYYLRELKEKKIPVLLVSGIFRESQPFFKWYSGIWKNMLRSFRHLFVQTDRSKSLLESIGFTGNISVTGDTRFDRVIDIAEEAKPLPELLLEFTQNRRVLVAGSTWEEDEAELRHYVKAHPEVRFIIAPHEIHPENIRDVLKEFPGAICYSDLIAGEKAAPENIQVLIIDNIGMLSRLYRYGHVAYVGGGFGEAGIHNVLEAAVYGRPVIFGPEHEKFAEAVGLVACGGAFAIENALQLEELLNRFFTESDFLRDAGKAAKNYVYSQRGATEKIINYIQENRLLIS
ncbi:MAG: Three-deoxy-D-manno-octulosonic-acid transferase protein [Ferruginibacter sp.]|nr:Three-deoxy-D-manno-octulosonic-acid transferase protein [Ferruginibacter sp.]